MTELFKLCWKEIKKDPVNSLKEIIGGSLLLGTMMYIFYVLLWIVCPC